MAKWIYVAHMGKDNPVCRDVWNIEDITLESYHGYDPSIGLVADGIRYYFGSIKPSVARLLGYTDLEVIQKVKTQQLLKIEFGPYENLQDGEEIEFELVYSEKECYTGGICDDPRILCIVNRVWNTSFENADASKISGAILIPTHEEALKYLRDREYATSCITDVMMNKYSEAHPGWEDRMYITN